MQTLRVLVFALLVALLSAAPVAEDGATVEKINAIFSDEDAPPVVEGTAAADTILEEAANSDDQEEEEEEEQEQEQEANDIAGIVETEELDIPEEEQETDDEDAEETQEISKEDEEGNDEKEEDEGGEEGDYGNYDDAIRDSLKQEFLDYGWDGKDWTDLQTPYGSGPYQWSGYRRKRDTRRGVRDTEMSQSAFVQPAKMKTMPVDRRARFKRAMDQNDWADLEELIEELKAEQYNRGSNGGYEKRASPYDEPQSYFDDGSRDVYADALPYDTGDTYRGAYERPSFGDEEGYYNGAQDAAYGGGDDDDDWRYMGPSEPAVYRRAFYPVDYRYQLPALPGERKRSYPDEADLQRWESYEARKGLQREALNDEIINLARYLARVANDEDNTALFDEDERFLRK